ncbi:MAG: hypothetical protein J2P27_06975 [Actinobacteria bacterium]|nr:hypothetical protein [Actinomycetota bacterium]
MATTPLNRIVLAARSVADDLSYVALTDIAGVLGSRTTDYRITGGLMVTAHVARWDLGGSLYRETRTPISASRLWFCATLISRTG